MSTVDLTEHAALVTAYDAAVAEAKKWIEAAEVLKKRLQAAMGEATVAEMDGRPAFTWKPTGQFNEKRFTAEMPELASQYMVTVERVDTGALAKDHPTAYAAYRARRFERKA